MFFGSLVSSIVLILARTISPMLLYSMDPTFIIKVYSPNKIKSSNN